MKEIFDWLREAICEGSQCINERYYTTVVHSLSCVNEAEAKWEAECCIRVIGKPFTSSCGQKYDKWTYVGEPYCAKCGKLIKISEVE